MEERTNEPSIMTDSPTETTLSNEARERMERNRQQALERLARKRKLDSPKAQTTIRTPAPPSQFMQDTLNVASEGSIVRVHGTKLIDTGGGFLLEEKDLEEPENEEITGPIAQQLPPPIIPSDAPHCIECQHEFQESYLLRTYDHPVCDTCKDIDEKHKLITRTDAKTEYLLKDVDLDKREPILKYISKPNPHNSRWGDMKLYLRLQVEKRALEVWESLETLEKEKEKREENKVKTKLKKYDKKMSTLRRAARSSLYTRDLTPHEHKWGEDSYNSDDDTYTHVCTECGQNETYEKM